MIIEEKEQQDEFIKLKHINTDEASKNFAKLLNENKTYFLNARWGAGKTEFLESSQKYTSVNNKNKKFIVLDFWRLTDERSVLAISFSKLMPRIYLGIRMIMILSVVISILMTDVVNIGLYSVLVGWGINKFLYRIGAVISLFIAVWSFFKIKSDSFYIKILDKKRFNKQVLIVDDFDRINGDVQEQLYKVFNLLENKIPIVFVGDYEKIAKNEDSYLQKIISKKIDLPFDLHPNKIWMDYFNELESKINTIIPQEFKEVAIGEGRNLRERQQFNDYVNHELFIRNKLYHVQPVQQLLVIYVYLFHPNYYKNLVTNNDFDFAIELEEIKKVKERKFYPDYSVKEKLQILLCNLQRGDSDEYPFSFMKNRQGYLLYEQPMNRTVQELDSLIENDDSLKECLLSNYDKDFYKYIQSKYKEFPKDKRNRIFSISINLVKEYHDSATIRYIITEKNNEIKMEKEYMGINSGLAYKERADRTDIQIKKEIYDSWHFILEKYNFDFTEEIYLIIKYSGISFNNLGLLFPNIDLNNYINCRRRDFLLLVYISSKNLWGEFAQWSENIWKFILSFSDEEFLSFWKVQGILYQGRGFEFDISSEDKNYTVWLSKRDFNQPGKTIDNTQIVNRIKPKLEQLERKGYIFIEDHD